MIWASMASVSSRYAQREIAIKSLAPQVTSITWHNGDTEGDKLKFKDAQAVNGVYLSCDDDLWYPNDYAARMQAKLLEYGNKVIVTCMGRIIHGKVLSYYKTDMISKLSCLGMVEKDTFVHIGGTGVMAFHTDYFRPDLSEFKNGYMADIWLALQAQRQQVPILCMAHEANWIQQQDAGEGIYERFRDNDKEQTKAVNSINWVIYETEKV